MKAYQNKLAVEIFSDSTSGRKLLAKLRLNRKKFTIKLNNKVLKSEQL
jgi:sulfur carrier protein ThiS